MNACENFNRDLDAWLDATLEPGRRAELDRHAESCPTCRQRRERAAAIEQQIRAEASTWTPPDDLWARIETSAGRAARRRSPRRRAAAVAAVLALLAVGVVGLLRFDLQRDAETGSTAAALVNEFHTFVASRRELDYREARPANLRDWFGDKVEFRVPLPLSSPAFMLAGGRLCNMFDQRIVSFMYRVDDAWVSLYIMQAPAGRKLSASGKQLLVNGYGYVEWQQQGLHYALVGDVPAERLRVIAERFERGAFGADRAVPGDQARFVMPGVRI